MTAAKAGPAMTTDRVNLVDEDNAGRILLALLEQIAHARRADTHKHFDKIRTRNREERNIGFTGDRSGQQSLARSRRAPHSDAPGHSPPPRLTHFRVSQKVD